MSSLLFLTHIPRDTEKDIMPSENVPGGLIMHVPLVPQNTMLFWRQSKLINNAEGDSNVTVISCCRGFYPAYLAETVSRYSPDEALAETLNRTTEGD